MRVIKKETHTTCQYKRKTVYAKDSKKIPHLIRCSRHALYFVDNIPMCKTHAGNYLLNEQLPLKQREGVLISNKKNEIKPFNKFSLIQVENFVKNNLIKALITKGYFEQDAIKIVIYLINRLKLKKE